MNKTDSVKINTKKKTLFALPPLDRYSSRQEWEDVCWHKILKSQNLFESLVTPYERHNLVRRAAVMDRINSGKAYKRIVEELWLSPQTISSIKRALKENGYRSYRERSKKERKKKTHFSSPSSSKRKRHGKAIRTKYGTLYMPY